MAKSGQQMKSVLSFALALAGVLYPAEGATHFADQIQISGKEYTRLTDWARANDFAVHWFKRDETLELTSGSTRIRLTVDSCEARIKGTVVYLLSPVAHRNGTVYIARQDVESTLHPILSPPARDGRARVVKTICIDPGHGGADPGFCVGRNHESKYTLLLAQEVWKELARAGFNVTLTRTSDSTVDLPVRPELAKERKADLFVSLHFNAAEAAPQSVRGTEVYCLTPAGACSTNARGEGGNAGRCAGNHLNERNLFLAYEMQKALIHSLETEDRGVRRARFAVLRDAAMPAILIEAGYLSHPVEGRKILDAGYRREIARAIVEGVRAYKRLVEPEPDLKTARR